MVSKPDLLFKNRSLIIVQSSNHDGYARTGLTFLLISGQLLKITERYDILLYYCDAINLHCLQTGNEKDVTMQAGKQRAVLPLIRKFNEHSGRLLNAVLYVNNSLLINTLALTHVLRGESAPKRRRTESGTEDVSDIPRLCAFTEPPI